MVYICLSNENELTQTILYATQGSCYPDNLCGGKSKKLVSF